MTTVTEIEITDELREKVAHIAEAAGYIDEDGRESLAVAIALARLRGESVEAAVYDWAVDYIYEGAPRTCGNDDLYFERNASFAIKAQEAAR